MLPSLMSFRRSNCAKEKAELDKASENNKAIKSENTKLQDDSANLQAENMRLQDENAKLKLQVENTQLQVENTQLQVENTQLEQSRSSLLPSPSRLPQPLLSVSPSAPLVPPPLAPPALGGPGGPPPPPPPPPMPPLPGALKSKDWREDYAAGIAKAAAAKEAAAAAAAAHVDTPEEEEETRKRAKKKVEAMASAHARVRATEAAVLGLGAPSENFTVSSREIRDALSKLSKSKPSIRSTDTSEIKSLQQIREEAAERKSARDAAKKKDIFDKKKAVFENPLSAGGKGTRRRYNNYKKTRKGRVNNRTKSRRIKTRRIKTRKIKTIRRKQ